MFYKIYAIILKERFYRIFYLFMYIIAKKALYKT